MRRLLVVGCALVLAPPAAAAPVVEASASPAAGLAPLDAVLVASGDAAAYRWEIAGTTVGEGPELRRRFEAGRHEVVVVGTSAEGEETRRALVVSAHTLAVRTPRAAEFGRRGTLTGMLSPPLPGARVTLERDGRPLAGGSAGAQGRFSIGFRAGAPGSYAVRVAGLGSAPVGLRIRPRIEVAVGGPRLVGGALRLAAKVRPSGAGAVSVRVLRPGMRPVTRRGAGRAALRLRAGREGSYRVRAVVQPVAGWLPARHTLTLRVRAPRLALGSRGVSVFELERRLVGAGYALPRVDARFDLETAQAVLAFRKVHGLPPSGRVTPRVWRRLETAGPVRPRHPRGNHIEVDKRRQLLFLVRRGRVVLVSHVSTGATGNTPVGRWRVYRKVTGWDWVLWYPMYFLRGFAIHGYPSVPSYPASHGCVRVPMWLAPRLYERNGHGTVIYVYER